MNSDLAVKISGLDVKFNAFYAVKNISFSVKKGEIFGFLGANGAGKTTTIRVLCGLLRPSGGSVNVGGIKYETEIDGMNIKQKVGYMSQKFTLYNDLTIEENLSFMANLRNLNHHTYIRRRNFILDFISFNQSLKSLVRELSGGIKQQISLAAAILHDPEIVFLDEPTAGVSPAMRAKFWSLIRDLASLGKTIFVTTHYLDESEQCQRIALMRAGAIIALDTPNALKTHFFPKKIWEMTPKTEISYSKMTDLQHSEFKFFEPYGLKFHAEFKDSETALKLKHALAKTFEIKKINPTMEDVFIKAVEEKI
jgi:ABC-2 type transport system ATP-binding protein